MAKPSVTASKSEKSFEEMCRTQGIWDQVQAFAISKINSSVQPNRSVDIDPVEFKRRLQMEQDNPTPVDEATLADLDVENGAVEENEAVANLDFSNLPRVSDISRALKKEAKNMTDQEARFLTDTYYSYQGYRIRSQNQIRALIQGADSTGPEGDRGHIQVLEFFSENASKMEEQLKGALDIYTKNHKLGSWLRSIHAIGPCIAAGILSNIDITKAKSSGSLQRLAGIAPHVLWLSVAKTEDALQKIWPKGSSKYPTIEQVAQVNNFFGRKYQTDALEMTWDELRKKLSRMPHNASLKKIMWLCSKSMILHQFSGKDKWNYGREVFVPRKVYETMKNERGDYADQAAHALATKNFGEDTQAIVHLRAGRLPPAHIQARCARFLQKIVLSNIWTAWHWVEYQRIPARPYAMSILGHMKEIEIPNCELINFPMDKYLASR